jgi:hypothetical protein
MSECRDVWKKVIQNETKKEVEEMEKNQPRRCVFQKIQELKFDRVEISSSFVFYFLSLFPQVFQMPFLASIQVYSSLSALLCLSLCLLHRPYMGFSQIKHITSLGSNMPIST